MLRHGSMPKIKFDLELDTTTAKVSAMDKFMDYRKVYATAVKNQKDAAKKNHKEENELAALLAGIPPANR